MKKQIIILAGMLLAISCKELPPRINYDLELVPTIDTTYITSDIPQPEKRSVYIEDVTGIRCPNCPTAAETAKKIKEGSPNNVVIVAIHPLSIGNFTAPLEGDSLNTQEGEDIIQNIIGVPLGLPAGSVNRITFSGENYNWVWPTKWTGYANEILAEMSDVNLEAELITNKEAKSAIINIKTTFQQEEATPTNLTIMLLEDDIVGYQYTPNGKIDDYTHEHVLRKTITPYSGVVLAQEAQKGTVVEKGFNFNIEEEYVFDNCSIVVLVHKMDADNKEVLQCLELKIKE